jgi:deaminated glutathione amidase
VKKTFPKKPLRVGVLQMQSTDNVEANIEKALSSIDRVGRNGCDLICLPENALYLRLKRDVQKVETVFDLTESFWRKFSTAAKTHNVHILIGSVPLKKDGAEKPANTTVWVKSDGTIVAAYEKIHLFDVDVKGAPPVRESDFFVRGEAPRVIEIADWRIGLSICYDMRFAELYATYAKENVHLLLMPSAFLVPTGQAHWHVLLRARAIENQAFVIAAAQSGEHKSETGGVRHTFGHSLVVSPWGEVLLDLTATGADEKIVSLDPEFLVRASEQIPMNLHRRLR